VIACLVTDRRRFVRPVPGLLDQIGRAVDAAIDMIQIRERDMAAGALADLVREALAIARGSRTRIVVNDRLDVAIGMGAHGVHLRHDSLPVAAARALAPPPFLVGRSVHHVQEARAAAGADYVIAGTVFPTSSKPLADAWLGVDGLRAVVTAALNVPVLAIGGVTLDRVDAIAAAGAAGVAAIGLFVNERLTDTAVELRRRFDSPGSAS
jgi:thiamine-phosphate pyrophosphorylase